MRKTMRNVYLSTKEHVYLSKLLTTHELNLYILLLNSAVANPSVRYFDANNLANELGISVAAFTNAHNRLIKLNLARIVRFKDEDLQDIVRVIVGREQMELYSLGIKMEISSSRTWKKLIKQYPILDPSLSMTDREILINQYNQEYMDNL